MTKCSLPKSSNCNVEIACLLDEPLYDYVEIEHQAIRDRFNELFTFTAIHSDEKLNWGEETYTEEEEETEQPTEGPSKVKVEEKMNPNITFRQVSGFHFDKVEYFIKFNFLGLTNEHLDPEYYSIMDLN